MLLRDQNVQAEIKRLFLHKPRISRTLIKVMQDTCDMVKCPGKYIAWINQAINAYTRIMSKRILNVPLRL